MAVAAFAWRCTSTPFCCGIVWAATRSGPVPGASKSALDLLPVLPKFSAVLVARRSRRTRGRHSLFRCDRSPSLHHRRSVVGADASGLRASTSGTTLAHPPADKQQRILPPPPHTHKPKVPPQAHRAVAPFRCEPGCAVTIHRLRVVRGPVGPHHRVRCHRGCSATIGRTPVGAGRWRAAVIGRLRCPRADSDRVHRLRAEATHCARRVPGHLPWCSCLHRAPPHALRPRAERSTWRRRRSCSTEAPVHRGHSCGGR